MTYQVRELREISDQDKIAIFDKLYAEVRHEYDERVRGRDRFDAWLGLGQGLMEKLLANGPNRDDFWDHLNSLTNRK